MNPERLRELGWQPIVSDAQAHQLLRRELKHHSHWQQRDMKRIWDYQTLLAIKPGNWFKFLGNPKNGYTSILLWRMR